MPKKRKPGGKIGRKLSAKTRKRRIADALARLDNGQSVSNRDLKSLLTPSHYSDYEGLWGMQKFLREEAADATKVFARYVKKLRTGDLLDGKAGTVANARTAVQYSNRAEAIYERAIEILDETLEKNPAAARHLGRPRRAYDLSEHGGLSCDRMQMPRLKYGSTALGANQNAAELSLSKAAIKRQALERALNEIDKTSDTDHRKSAPLTSEARKSLREKIANLKSGR